MASKQKDIILSKRQAEHYAKSIGWGWVRDNCIIVNRRRK